MLSRRMALCVTLLLAALPASQLLAQTNDASPDVPMLHSTTSLVFLDVTVLDRHGKPVVKGLTKDDFTITEDKRPQRIFSFEAPEVHAARSQNPDEDGLLSIFVLDQLNSPIEDLGFMRDSMQRYLEAQPAQLSSPAELMVVGNRSTEMVQGFTRNRDDLLFALKHTPNAYPWKLKEDFKDERFLQSIQALQQIALQTKGLVNRKNIVWLGYGAPNINTVRINPLGLPKLERFIHQTTNMLVDGRISLFVIYPQMQGDVNAASHDAHVSLSGNDPFAGDINFGVFVNETGGRLFDDNDVDHLIYRAQQLSSKSYTLTYQPHEAGADGKDEGKDDGKFRPILVTLRDPTLRVITKGGYYAPNEKSPIDPRQQAIINVSDAVLGTIPFNGLTVKIENVVRHPDSGTAEFTVLVQSKNINWDMTEEGGSRSNLIVAAICQAAAKQILASKLEARAFNITTQDSTALANQLLRVPMTIRVPRGTRSLRVAVETEDGSRIGAADLDRKTIEAAPAAPTPQPELVSRPASPQPASTQ